MEEVIDQLIDMDYYIKDSLYQFEVENKGCLLNVAIKSPDQLKYVVSFYTIKRFEQDMPEEMIDDCFFYEGNIIFLKKITLENILKTISIFNDRKMYSKLTPC
ncbi:MAG: hypothetical protein LBH06_08285 [Rikenellaceae bacterium]|nr:hypothetical protein [Rikenellaceae bacterium]